MKLYKVLVGGKSAHGGDLRWSLPKKIGDKWVAGKWQTVKGELTLCKKGLHLTSKPENWYKIGCKAYEAEYKGLGENNEDKYVASSARLIKEIPIKDYWKDVETFVASLKEIPWMKNDGNPKKEWKLFETRDAARGAAWDTVREAAWDAAWDAAGNAARGAAWNAARDAAGNAARDAAGNAAGEAARDAAGEAAWNAAWDAALMSGILVCKRTKLPKKYIKHANDRMEVWQKGYGLLCDINGVLYVYKKL